MCRKSSLKRGRLYNAPLYLEKNFGRFFPVFMHLGNECIYSVIFFFRAKILYELNAHFFVVDILREIEDVYLDTYIVAIIAVR